MDTGSITFFDINAFGFYRLKRDAKNLDFKFGTIVDVMDDLIAWLHDKNFEQTVPWNIKEQPLRTKVYCRGVAFDPSTKDYVIVIYRGVGDGNGIHGIKVGSKIGANVTGTVKAGSQIAGEEIIWGEPCYYWIIPELNKIASIRFPHSYADTFLFCNYFVQHVNNNSLFGERKTSERHFDAINTPGRVVKVYQTTFPYKDIDGKCNCIFKFNVEETKLKTAKEDLARMRSRIVQTIIRDTTTKRINDDRQPILQLASDTLSSLFGPSIRDKVLGKPPEVEQPKRVQVIVDGAPSLEELNQLFNLRDESTDWADVGFKLLDTENPIWLTKYVARTKLPITNSEGDEHYSPEFLLAQINLIRGDLVLQLKLEAEKELKRKEEEEAEKKALGDDKKKKAIEG
ncbi:hypothetical protein SJI19_21925 [Acerihabitans sp. TG2]|uniref:hypothetical protein n=1 Tax=Acerihabitans sp. TG2 TaxID=3096008 RepID=UPI002B239924|nr:hypothetical protein [Acerihabitans sp. TG2]MEA9393163.1 hypothetical protein [Acerihabitans sp. TG2]